MVVPKFGFLLTFALGLTLAGCSAVQQRLPPTPGPALPPIAGAEAPVPGARRYEIDSEASQILVYVYRTGRMARLGHNHLVSVQNLEGHLWLADPLSDSRVEIRFPVQGLVVDDPELRAGAGSEFDTGLSRSDVEKTRRNMLGGQVLDAAAHPWIVVRATPAGGEPPELELDAEIEIRGQARRFPVPVHLEAGPDRVLVSGELALRQSDFGMIPYSVLGGALAVRDELEIVYRLVAHRRD
ncbi:MAG: YceI family protein [Gammaproteobacteria bacterium]|jgi:polyisoprenoid-binding protein YceI